MASLFTNPGQWFKDTGKAIERDWRNAGRGEIGRFVGGAGQSVYNVAVAVPNAVRTGDWDKHVFQKGVFSAANVASFGTLDYLGGSSAFQRGIGSDPIIGKNIAAFARVTRGGGRDAQVSNSDRNLSVQGAVKIGAAAAAWYGGSALYAKYGADGAAASGAGDFLASSGGAPVPGVLTAPAYGSSGAGLGTLTTSSAAAGGSSFMPEVGGFFSDLWTGTKTLGKTILTTGITQKLLGGGGGSAPGSFDGGTSFTPGGVNIALPGSSGYYDGPVDGYLGSDGLEGSSGTTGKLLLVGALVIGAAVIYKAVKK